MSLKPQSGPKPGQSGDQHEHGIIPVVLQGLDGTGLRPGYIVKWRPQ